MSCILEAHRGVGTEYPENTLSAFRAAVRQGYGMIELDTKFTSDNVCVILHDGTVSRMARHDDGSAVEGKVNIADLTLAEAKALDFGIAKGEEHRGVRICTLQEVLDFAAEEKIPLKFDNVLQSHTPEQLSVFCETVRASKACPYCGFTSNNVPFIEKMLAEFPGGTIHYDGPVTDEALDELSRVVPSGQLYVWMRYDNEHTSWCKTPPVSEEMARRVKSFAKLGLWLLTKQSELDDAEAKYDADVAETDGSLKPIRG